MLRDISNNGALPRGRVTDVHMHVLPGVDDGARTMEEACRMLRLAGEEGIETVFATPHCAAFLAQDVRPVFRALREEIRREKIPVELRLGCEMRITPETAELCVQRLNSGVYPTMGGSGCVLAEFVFGTSPEDYFLCVGTLLDNGYTPILAHLERFSNVDLPLAGALREAGALIQINACSVADESDKEIRRRANLLLSGRLADFLGTDGHRPDRRPPLFRRGMETLTRLCGEDYARRIAIENPQNYLPGSP